MNEQSSFSRIDTLRLAAGQAADAHEYQSAVEIYTLALELVRSPQNALTDSEVEAKLVDGRARANHQLGNFDAESDDLDALYQMALGSSDEVFFGDFE